MTSAPPVYLILSEASLPAAAWAILRGRPLALIEIQPMWERSRPWLERVAARWLAEGKMVRAGESSPALVRILENINYHDMTDLFLTVEPWVEAYFRFSEAETANPAYHLPYKHTCWGEIYDSGRLAHMVELINREAGGGAEFIGISPTATRMAEIYGKRPIHGGTPWTLLRLPANLLMALVVMAFTLLWVARRVVGQLPEGRSFLLGSTFAKDIRLVHNLGDIVDSREQCCIMFHDEAIRAVANRDYDLAGFSQCLFGDGRFLPGQAMQALGGALADLAGLIAAFWRLPPLTFLKLARLAWYRVAYRALFRRHRFANFWGRDEINSDHMIRSQELRRIGGTSMGMAHGIPSSQILSPLRRIQDYNVYFCFGMHLYQKYYHARWPAHIRAVPLGAFGMSHAQMMQIRRERSRDIMVFVSSTLNDEAIVDVTVDLARLMPERTVFFKCKRGAPSVFQRFIDGDPPAPPNLVVSDTGIDVTYEFLRTGGYAVATHSTLGAEGIYYGTPTFVQDNNSPDMPFYYREFDRLCFTTAEELVERIRAIEEGRDTYPWHNFDGLIRLDNRFPMAVVREVMGLPPKPDENICLPLAHIRGDAV
ncbi:hypothetical protein H261_07998 [Paramagnetospirillum caucaseum]|uniref:Capsule polysaccharide biosynthesis protein n=1 Tax=Paramagnetospirillum caucaseum TaxID=1244869 RepID=M2YC26_9PROT|nr:hypothetical protein [Paramagnetospirillum caucaseum]EME70556.1 hypothetical protein H261_07998 [Paramagnetospirillum caucaseum]